MTILHSVDTALEIFIMTLYLQWLLEVHGFYQLSWMMLTQRERIVRPHYDPVLGKRERSDKIEVLIALKGIDFSNFNKVRVQSCLFTFIIKYVKLLFMIKIFFLICQHKIVQMLFTKIICNISASGYELNKMNKILQ